MDYVSWRLQFVEGRIGSEHGRQCQRRVDKIPEGTFHVWCGRYSPWLGGYADIDTFGCGADGVCVCVFSSHSFWISSSLDVPAGVTQEEGHAGFLIHLLSAVRALIFLARRIQPFLSLVDREVEFCVLTI